MPRWTNIETWMSTATPSRSNTPKNLGRYNGSNGPHGISACQRQARWINMNLSVLYATTTRTWFGCTC